jgi:transcriptional regulator with XRE-family HTH domain
MSVSFGDSIRRGREAAGLSQARLAQLIGRSPSTVRAWEQGRSNPGDAGSVAALAAVLGLDEDHLLGKAGFEPRPPSAPPQLETELASLRTIEIPVTEASPRHLEAERGTVATADPLPEPWIEVDKPPIDIREWLEPKVKSVITRAREVGTDLRERWKSRPRREPGSRPAEEKQRLQTAASGQSAEPALRLDPRLGPLVAKSYVEDDHERDFYLRRMVGTLLVLVFLFITLWWALRNAGGAIGDFVGGFIDELNIE